MNIHWLRIPIIALALLSTFKLSEWAYKQTINRVAVCEAFVSIATDRLEQLRLENLELRRTVNNHDHIEKGKFKGHVRYK